MTIQRWPTQIILIILLMLTTVETAPPGPHDFAYGLSLEVEGKSALWQLVLPATLYRRVTRPDLGDMRVFDAAGHVMPHTLQRSEAPLKAVTTLLKTLGDARTSPLIKAARAGSERTLGGAERLRPPAAPVPWKQMLLWGVLLLGVAVLGIMVRQLYRQLKADTT